MFVTILPAIGGPFVGGCIGSLLGPAAVAESNPGRVLLGVGGAVLLPIPSRLARR